MIDDILNELEKCRRSSLKVFSIISAAKAQKENCSITLDLSECKRDLRDLFYASESRKKKVIL